MIKEFAGKILHLNMKPNYTFVQDNSRVHTSKLAKAFLTTLPCDVLEWPARSADLNLIENVWKMISDLVYKDSQASNFDDLRRKVRNAVHEINTTKREVISDMFCNYQRRLTSVLISKGNLIN